jgi:Animal haem peroxidase
MDSQDRPVRPSGADGRFSRRRFLAGAAALSAGALVGQQAGVAHAEVGGSGLHGAELRGIYLPSKDRLAEGRFGLMFKRLPAYAPSDELLTDLAQTMVEPDSSDSFLNTNPRLFAGFTFIAQFIDHDITLDTTPLELQQADPDATVNFRTPRYDLDSLYGQGPAYEPQFYDPADRDKLLLAPNVNGVLDLGRDGDGRAIIPDRRNDENLIISQFHKAVAQFHNKIVDYARSQGIRREWVFETARRLTRWHYQWAVIHDFLPRFVQTPGVDELVGPNGTVYKEVAGKPPVINLNYYKPTNRDGRPFMPVEFAVAAYRFGHSIIRPFYVINQATLEAGGVPIFGPDGGFNLNGGRPIPSDLVMVWKNILPVVQNQVPPARPPRKIDTKLSIPLTNLPGSAVPPPDPTKHLAVRNTLRGKHVGLPSGQQVARAMRVNVLSNATLGLSNDPGWVGEAPLWFYILKEAELPPYNAERLGPVGGRIMAETLVGLLQRDPNSYLYLNAAWKPAPPIAPTAGVFGFVDLLKYAGAA